MSQNQPANRFQKGDRLFLGLLLAAGFLVGLLGIVHLGYIGQDFDGIEGHNYLIRNFPDAYSFRLTNPPGLYWLGNLIFRHITSVYYLEILASCFLVMNLAGLWLLFPLLWEMIDSRRLRYAAAALITFVPFRTIHAIVISSDAVTLPFFAVVAVITLRLLKNPRSVFGWVALSLVLSVAIGLKYTFVGMLVPIAAVLGLTLIRELAAGERARWINIALCSLALPAGIFLIEMRLSDAARGGAPSTHWKRPGDASAMRWSDLLTLQQSDAGIFSAPQYFQDRVYGFRKFSYMGLVHLSSFTDSQNFFQKPPAKISASWRQRSNDGFLRERTPWSQALQQASVAWCVPDSILAIAGALGFGALALLALAFPRRALLTPAALIVTALAWGFFGPIFFNLPRVGDPYTAGYWLPRLVLPGLLMFFALGFAGVDFALRRLRCPPAVAKTVEIACLAHTAVACALFAGFLC